MPSLVPVTPMKLRPCRNRERVVVGDRPVGAEAVASIRLEIVIGEAEGDAAVVVGAAAEDAGTEPAELAARGNGVRLALDFPVAVGRFEPAHRFGAEIMLAVFTGAAMRHSVRPHVLLKIARRIDHRPGFQEKNVHAEPGQGVNGRPSTRARTDYYDIIYRSCPLNLKHD